MNDFSVQFNQLLFLTGLNNHQTCRCTIELKSSILITSREKRFNLCFFQKLPEKTKFLKVTMSLECHMQSNFRLENMFSTPNNQLPAIILIELLSNDS